MARQRPELDQRFRHSKLQKYLLADENVLVAQRQHWAVLWKPILIGVAALVVVVTLNFLLPPSTLTDLLWWALLVVAVWGALKWIEWRRNWMVATDKRVMINHGLINQGVAMFSLSRVPDLTYTRSTIGRILGYGELMRESAGVNQTLHKVTFVEHPHATYTTICAAIFDLQDRMFGMDEDENEHRFEDGPPPHTPGLYSGHLPSEERPVTEERPVRTDFPRGSDLDDEPVGIHVRYGTSSSSPQGERQTWHQSPDMRDPALREADTGPIPYRRPATDEGEGWLPTNNDSDRNRDDSKISGQNREGGQNSGQNRDR
jgi:hypothetical protein